MILPVFPQEIFDQIVEHARDDRGVLLAASLVCRNWVQTSRQYLFRSITLRPTTLKGFSILCCPNTPVRPTFLRHIRNIVFERSGSKINYFAMPAPSVYLDRDLLAWLPKFEAVESVSICSIEWESREILNRFGSLFPKAKSLTLRANTLNKLSHGLTLICAFPTLQSVYWSKGIIATPNRPPLTTLPEMPKNRTLPSQLTMLSFGLDPFSRDALIQNIPLGNLRLQNFQVYISTSESLSCLSNVLLFMNQHCLNVSTLCIVFHETDVMGQNEWDHWNFETKLEEFLNLFSEFRSLKHITLCLRTDWDVRVAPWFYHALASLRSDLKIETLLFELPSPKDERGAFIPDHEIDEKMREEYLDSCVDWDALDNVLALNQFRELEQPFFDFHRAR